MTVPNRRRVLTAAAALALAGCASLPLNMQPPEVSVSDLRLLDVGLLEQRFGLSLRVLNPNDAEIPIDGLSFTVELNGKPCQGREQPGGHRAAPQRGHARGRSRQLTHRLLRQFGAMAKGQERIDYRIHGTLGTGRLFGGVPFDQKGEVDFADLGVLAGTGVLGFRAPRRFGFVAFGGGSLAGSRPGGAEYPRRDKEVIKKTPPVMVHTHR
ncbi:MAG: LEA type 2 family protein [Rhodocyclaceae bacterium]